MSVTYHQRPGVYSDYDASSVSSRRTAQKIVAVAAWCTTGSGLYTLTDSAQAAQLFGDDSQLAQMVQCAFLGGAGTVMAVPVSADTKAMYDPAVDLILAEKKARLLVLGSLRDDVQQSIRDKVRAMAKQKGECIALMGMDRASVSQMLQRAASLNDERVVLVGPNVFRTGVEESDPGTHAAAVLAGVLAAQTDPALPLNGAALPGLSGVDLRIDDAQLDALILGGVTVVEYSGGQVSVVRGVTTRTKTGDAADDTFRELNTILIIDDVIPAIRESLRAKFSRAKNNAVTRGAIRSQVIVELEDRVAREILDGYVQVTVQASKEDPTVCLVEFGMTVTHGLNRIYLTAHITV